MSELSKESQKILKDFMKGKVTEEQLKEYEASLCWVDAVQFNQAFRMMVAVCGFAMKRFKAENTK